MSINPASHNGDGLVRIERSKYARSSLAREVTAKYVLGSLTALSTLESAVLERQKEEVRAVADSQTLLQQSQKIQKLKQKRDELMQQLHNTTNTESGDGADEADIAVPPPEAQDPELKSALAYLSELQEKLNIYKLTGVSVVKTGADSKVLCLTTSYKGEYLESYHLELRRLASGRFKVVRHNLPSFIVFSSLPSDLEVKDVLSAVRPLKEVLAMFVLRREELKTSQAKHPAELDIVETSAAFDFICFHLAVHSNIQVEITLRYADLNNFLPASVSAVPSQLDAGRPKEGLSEKTAGSLQRIFQDNHLSTAMPLAIQLLTDYFTPQE